MSLDFLELLVGCVTGLLALLYLGVIRWQGRVAAARVKPVPQPAELVRYDEPLRFALCHSFEAFTDQPQVSRYILDCPLIREHLSQQHRDLLTIGAVLDRGGVGKLYGRLKPEILASLAVIYAAVSGKAKYSLIVGDRWSDTHKQSTLVRKCLQDLRVQYENGNYNQIHIGTARIRFCAVHRLTFWLSGKPDLVFIAAGPATSLQQGPPEPWLSVTRKVLAGETDRIPKLIIDVEQRPADVPF